MVVFSRYGNTAKKLQEQRKRYQDEWSKYYWNEFVLKNLDKPLNWNELSRNPNISWNIVISNPDKLWDWYGLSRNPNITMDIVKANPNKPWDWYGLSRNPNISMEIVEANPNKCWDWQRLSGNLNISWEIVEANSDKSWHWNRLSRNPFKKGKEIFMEKKMREYLAAFKIQTYWRKANYDPQYELCKRRLMRECDIFGIEN